MPHPSKSGFGGWLADAVLDLTAITGAVMICHGIEQIYHPAGVIAGGIFLLGGAWLSARKSA